MNPLSLLRAADDAASWERAGFRVNQSGVVIAGITIQLAGSDSGRGLTGWAFDGRPGGGSIDGIVVVAPPAVDPIAVVHPNGIIGIDHVVLMTGDVDRTLDALAVVGSEERRRRQVVLAEAPSLQVFCWSGGVIVEVVGPAEPTGGAASLWGVTLVADDLDATVEALGDLSSPARLAVQPGRRIASINRHSMGSSVRLAVMDPHRGGQSVTDERRSPTL